MKRKPGKNFSYNSRLLPPLLLIILRLTVAALKVANFKD